MNIFNFLSRKPEFDMKINNLLSSESPVKWVFYGDSITHGSLHTFGQRSYVELFSERIRYELDRSMDIVINTAISGNTTQDLLESFEWRVAGVKPDVVFLMIGMNDCHRQKGISVNDFEANLLQLVSLIKDINAIPIMQTTCPPLVGKPDYESYSSLDLYMDSIRRVASVQGLMLIEHTKLWQKNREHHDSWMNNLVHPNAMGHRVLARTLFEHLDIYDKAAPSSKLPITSLPGQIKAVKTMSNKVPEISILPIDRRLAQVDASHPTLSALLNLIQNNVIQSRRHQPWKAPRWKTAKITAQHIEEIGLLARLNPKESASLTEEAMNLASELMQYHHKRGLPKELGDYYELFLAETALSLIYLLEYFSPFISEKQQQILEQHFSFVSDALWDLILASHEYDDRTQSRLAWNHSQFVHAIMGICAIKQCNKHSDARLERAILWIEGYLSHSLTWDGFSREGIFYIGATRMPLLLFLMALKEHKSIDLLNHAGLTNHWQYLINEWIPDTTTFITRNDINHVKHSTTLSSLPLYAYLFQCKKALTLWDTIAGEKGDKTFGNPSAESNRNGSLVLNFLFYPTELSLLPSIEPYIEAFKVYREAGVVVGYSKQQASFKYSFQASSHFAEIHSQSDHGQIYLYLNGDTLLGDASVGNNRNAETPGQSEGHNALMIDGKGMALSGSGWQTCSVLEDATCHGDYHSMRANLTPAYNAYHSRVTLAYYKRLVIVHAAEPYHIVVLDSVSDYHEEEHKFSYRFHTHPDHTIGHEDGNIHIEAPHSELKIVPLGLNWDPQSNKQFVFKNETRSTYIDAEFLSRDFIGGYILIPTTKKTLSVQASQNQVVLSTKTHESKVTLHQGLENNKRLSCQTIQKANGGRGEDIVLSSDDSTPDHLTGELLVSHK